MKKFVSCLILIICSLIIVACGKDPSISYKKDRITINMGNNYVISSSDIEVKNDTGGYEIISLNEEIAEVNGYIVSPKQAGETIIRIQLLDNNSIKFDIKLIVTNITYATSAEVENDKVYINLTESSVAYNPITLSENCNEVPELRYDSNIISYDYVTGKITAKAIGETSVVVLYRGYVVSFRVFVTDVVYTKSMVVEDCVIIEGYSGKFKFSIFPDNANTYNFFTASNILSVTSDGYYETSEVGTATVYCEYTSGPESTPIMLMFNVTIIEHIDNFDIGVVDATSGQTQGYYLTNKKYRLYIYSTDIPVSNLSVVGDVTLASQLVMNEDGVYVDFYFARSGDVGITVNASFDGKNVALSSSQNCLVSRLSDVEVRLKWEVYYQEVRDDDKYYISLTALESSSLRFVPTLDDDVIYEDMIVYDVTSGSRVEVSATFTPTEIGEYTFEFTINGTTLGRCTVVIEE